MAEFAPWLEWVLLPALAFLFVMQMRQKDALADFKLHVAEKYASVEYLKDVEERLIKHLGKIEKKLDTHLENNRNAA